MPSSTLFDSRYAQHRNALLDELLVYIRGTYAPEEEAAMRIESVDPELLAQRSGRGFVNRDILETVLGNLLECVAPGSHNARMPYSRCEPLRHSLQELADQLYAMIAQSLLAAGESGDMEERALHNAFGLLYELPHLKQRALWNRFASLRDPAVWDAYLMHNCPQPSAGLAVIDFTAELELSIRSRDMDHYRRFMHDLGCDAAVDYQLQLVMCTYPGWRVLLYHDAAHALTHKGPVPGNPTLERTPVPFLPRAVSELGGRYYQADLHPETCIGDANFLDHTHHGITTGQTGMIGSGCHLLPCTMGGLSEKVQQRHPLVGNYVFVGTDVGLFGSVRIGDDAVVGPNTEIHGHVELGSTCRIGASAFIGTIKSGDAMPGRIRLGKGVRVGAGTIVENSSRLDLVIPDYAEIPARSHVTNDGFGRPCYTRG